MGHVQASKLFHHLVWNDPDMKHAQYVWNIFNMKILGNYQHLDLKSDML